MRKKLVPRFRMREKNLLMTKKIYDGVVPNENFERRKAVSTSDNIANSERLELTL